MWGGPGERKAPQESAVLGSLSPGQWEAAQGICGDSPGWPAGGIEEARAAEGKRKAQKEENPTILERVPAERMTFTELAEWYLDLSPVKKLSSYTRIKQGIANFNRGIRQPDREQP